MSLAWALLDPALHFLRETDAVPDYLGAADAYVSNTLDGGETWGLANLEALAAGVPILSSRVGGAAEMLRDGDTALLHDIPLAMDDSEDAELGAHMCRVVNETGLREGLSMRGRAYAREHLGHAYLEARITETLGVLGTLARRCVNGSADTRAGDGSSPGASRQE